MQKITREQLREKLDSDPKPMLIEVLKPSMYRKFHLPGAVNVPLDDDFDAEVQRTIPDKNAEVVVYCADSECDASPKAAKRMEQLGYAKVRDYAAGKQDWKDAGLPVEQAA